MNAKAPMTYAGTGVNYDAMDPFKRAAQEAARSTANALMRFEGPFRELAASRGESAYLIETPWGYLAHVEEGLGTKNLVADAMYQMTGRTFYDHIAQDTVAMIVNDMVTVGALPLSVAMHLAVGESSWFDDTQRTADLIEGWRRACELAGAAWGGGETPTLKGVVVPGTAVLSGSAMGILKPKRRLMSSDRVAAGDAIVLVESSGVHANGLTLCRGIAQKHPDGYLAKLGDGRSYGEALLDPTHIYVHLIWSCLEAGIGLHYGVNITGHGWRKLMRAPQPLRYFINQVPKPHPVFEFIERHGPVERREMYANFNMGAGFALFLPKSAAGRVVDLAGAQKLKAWVAGEVLPSESREVQIWGQGWPESITFHERELAVR